MKLSIIVPVYRAEAYLQTCVESILAQPFTEYELLLIHDASPDNSLEVAHALERKDRRITVYDKPHGGLGDTRNFGAQRAQGDYLFFVDADDWLGSGLLGEVIEPVIQANADLGVFNYVRENEANGVGRVCSLPLECPTQDPQANRKLLEELVGPDATASVWRTVEMMGSVCRRLFRRSWFLENELIFQDEEKVMLEDLPVSIQAHALSQRTLFLQVPLYHYRYNPDSLSTQYRPQKMEKLARCYRLVADFLRAQNLYDGLEERHMAWYLRNAAHSALVNVFRAGNPGGRAEQREEIRRILADPLLQRAADSRYFQHGTPADRLIRGVIRTGCVALVEAFYRLYTRHLQKNMKKQ